MPACPFLPDSPSRPRPAANTCANGDVSKDVESRRWTKRWSELEQLQGQKLGGADNPLLVSVRSGAKFSMPGMMDTILNLGLNDESVEGLAKRSNNPRFAYDSYRRLIQMFGSVVLEIPKSRLRRSLRRQEEAEESQARYRPRRQGVAGSHRRV